MKRRSRRQVLLGGIGAITSHSLVAQSSRPASHWQMPDEAAHHTRTWMAFGAQHSIWGRRLLPEVQKNLIQIANTISEFEPVSLLVRNKERNLVGKKVGANVSLHGCPLDDLWIRDTGPVFLLDDKGGKAAVDLNFNGWGGKQQHALDRKVAAFVARKAGVKLFETDLVLEGGCFEVDGDGTAILTESCVLNDNRNPSMSKSEFEDLFLPLFGLKKIIWLPGVRGKDITDGHVDFYARFVRPGVVAAGYEPDDFFADHEVTRENIALLREASDAHGRDLKVEVLTAPGRVRPKFESDDFAAGYVGYYVCNGAVLLQQFGDREADEAAQESLRRLFPDREIVALNVDGIAAGGGSIHCAPQQEPGPFS